MDKFLKITFKNYFLIYNILPKTQLNTFFFLNLYLNTKWFVFKNIINESIIDKSALNMITFKRVLKSKVHCSHGKIDQHVEMIKCEKLYNLIIRLLVVLFIFSYPK